jgi:pimeloyl-ACP methyl ester carboxylesterase
VTFDYTSLALLEIFRRQLERTGEGEVATPVIAAAMMVNGGLYADSHSHPWQGTALLRTPLGALGMWAAQRSPRTLDTIWKQARLHPRGYRQSPEELAGLRSAITRREGAAFLHLAAGFVEEHRRHYAQRWDLAAIARELDGTVAFYVGGSEEDPYEHRQVTATRERVPGAEVFSLPGGHLTTGEHPDLLAAAVRRVATRHGVGAAATDRR